MPAHGSQSSAGCHQQISNHSRTSSSQPRLLSISASSLSFLGVGITPPTPEWGAMLSDGRSYIRSSGWMCLFPGLAIMLTVLALNLLGDGLRDAMDPKLKR